MRIKRNKGLLERWLSTEDEENNETLLAPLVPKKHWEQILRSNVIGARSQFIVALNLYIHSFSLSVPAATHEEPFYLSCSPNTRSCEPIQIRLVRTTRRHLNRARLPLSTDPHLSTGLKMQIAAFLSDLKSLSICVR